MKVYSLAENVAALVETFPSRKAGEYIDEIRGNLVFDAFTDFEIVKAVKEAVQAENIRRNMEWGLRKASKKAKEPAPDYEEIRAAKWDESLRLIGLGENPAGRIVVVGGKEYTISEPMAVAAKYHVKDELKATEPALDYEAIKAAKWEVATKLAGEGKDSTGELVTVGERTYPITEGMAKAAKKAVDAEKPQSEVVNHFGIRPGRARSGVVGNTSMSSEARRRAEIASKGGAGNTFTTGKTARKRLRAA